MPSLLSPHSKQQLSGSLVEQLIPQAALSSQNREWLLHLIKPVDLLSGWATQRTQIFSTATAAVDLHSESNHVQRAQRSRWTFNHLHLCPWVMLTPPAVFCFNVRRSELLYACLFVQVLSAQLDSVWKEAPLSGCRRWVTLLVVCYVEFKHDFNWVKQLCLSPLHNSSEHILPLGSRPAAKRVCLACLQDCLGGQVCVTHPWEVLVPFVMLPSVLLSK